MYQLNVENDLGLSHSANSSLSKLIRASIRRKRSYHPPDQPQTSELCWGPETFLLDNVALYRRLDETKKEKIIIRYNQVLLSDFYFLEKSGLAYCAKMILLGETTEIRQLYALLASDEATHLEWFSPFVVGELRTHPQGKLLPVLGEIIKDCDANTLYYLVQTIIEGWGLMTYKLLSASCRSPVLSEILSKVMKDEAIHHKTGHALFDPRKIDQAASAIILDRMKSYAQILRVGPQTLVQCIEHELGELTIQELESLFSDLKTELTSYWKLQTLQNLMLLPQMEKFVQRLKDEGYDKPYTPSACAQAYLQSRGKCQFV